MKNRFIPIRTHVHTQSIELKNSKMELNFLHFCRLKQRQSVCMYIVDSGHLLCILFGIKNRTIQFMLYYKSAKISIELKKVSRAHHFPHCRLHC